MNKRMKRRKKNIKDKREERGMRGKQRQTDRETGWRNPGALSKYFG
jgi:hypothetical protein